MDYKKVLEELSKNVNFSKYDGFSREKKCHYIKYDNVDYAFIWQTVNPNNMKEFMKDLNELKKRIDEAKVDGAKLPSILAIYTDKNHVFQLQEKVYGKKFEYIEILDEKTTVDDFIELLITFDIMATHGIDVNPGRNCMVDENGHISIYDLVLAKEKNKVNANPDFFKKLVFQEPDYFTEENIEVLKRILEKWIQACVIYFKGRNLDRIDIETETELTIRNYSFISIKDKKEMVNNVLNKSLQKVK